jgi:hypothetical protein
VVSLVGFKTGPSLIKGTSISQGKNHPKPESHGIYCIYTIFRYLARAGTTASATYFWPLTSEYGVTQTPSTRSMSHFAMSYNLVKRGGSFCIFVLRTARCSQCFCPKGRNAGLP